MVDYEFSKEKYGILWDFMLKILLFDSRLCTWMFVIWVNKNAHKVSGEMSDWKKKGVRGIEELALLTC